MIRVRTPMFFPGFFGAYALIGGNRLAGLAADTGPLALESWRHDSGIVHALFVAGTVIAWVGGILLSLAVIGQIAIYRGWEPKILSRTLMGATVIDVHKEASGGRVTLAVPNRPPLKYVCDEQEFLELPVGTVAHVRVVGNQVAESRPLQGETADRIRAGMFDPSVRRSWLRASWFEESGSFGCNGWMFMLGLPVFSSAMLVHGLVTLAWGEAVVSRGRYSRSYYIVTGTEATVAGMSSLLIALVVLAVVVVVWIRGWDPNDFERNR